MKRLLSICTLALVVCVPLASVAYAQMETGRPVAERWCVNCHTAALPGRKNTVATDAATSFAQLSRLGADGIRAVLIAPHERMRGIDLTTRQIDLVADYIAGLKQAE